MNNQELLRKVITENPELPIKFFYSSEGCDDYDYTLGGIHKVIVDEIHVGDYVWIKGLEYETLIDVLSDEIAFDLYPDIMKQQIPHFTLEQEYIINLEVQKEINNMKWEKSILVYVGI